MAAITTIATIIFFIVHLVVRSPRVPREGELDELQRSMAFYSFLLLSNVKVMRRC